MSRVAVRERWNAFVEGPGPNGFGWHTTAEEVTEGLDLEGTRVAVTGCNSGLGYETMRVLSDRGASVCGAARSKNKARDACESVDGETVPVVCELSDLESVASAADEIGDATSELDVLVCNAGIMALPEREEVAGYEKQFFVNHVGHFALITELLDHLADDGRVVVLSSAAHRNAPDGGIRFDDLAAESWYDPWKAYGQSKLANLLTARELARRFDEDETDRFACAVHPGVIHTNLARHIGLAADLVMPILSAAVLKSVDQGAATETFAAVHPDARNHHGEYLADCNPSETTPEGRDMELASRLWEETEEIVENVGG